ncbi:hypothetical protein [Actinopolyspora halophila]|uniref:hypothetical protein n=1 Tax=Actinopolyspora halophila TaxID=1850 RepID=UPI000362415E|nr:hypothetical protein [Actinopolyspora halophila]
MVNSSRGLRRPSGEARVSLANAVIVVAASLITASLALILEDLLPRDDSDGYVVLTRWLAGITALVLLVVGLVWRARLHRKRGTLFYVQLLDEAMPNWHEQPLAAAQQRRMSMRSVVRWVDLGQRVDNGVIDVVEPCREIGAVVEEAINNDREDTGYTVAPNMLWPAALALGAYLPHPESLRLLELLPAEEREFALTERSRGRSGSVSGQLDGQLPRGRVGVWLAFTPAARYFSAEMFERFGVRTAHTVTFRGETPGPNYSPDLSSMDMAHLGGELAEHLVRVKKEAGERELVVVAMVPKSVMLAVGWQLSQHDCRFFRGTHLMHYDQASKDYIPMRVRESQPTTPPLPAVEGGPAGQDGGSTARASGFPSENGQQSEQDGGSTRC